MEEIDAWWNTLGYDDLAMVCGRCPDGRDANDFIDDCDEWWEAQSDESKRETYNHFFNLTTTNS